MKSETKDTILVLSLAAIILVNIFAIGMSNMSCICSGEDIECKCKCEQKNNVNCGISWFANVITLLATMVFLWLWSGKK